MTDYLTSLPEQQVAGWYRRLAERLGKERIDGQEPLAGTFLRHYLDNRDPKSTFEFQAPNYLQMSPFVITVLQYHRDVFLSQKQARVTGGRTSWAGVLPRIQGLPNFTRWDLKASLEMEYESLVEVGSGFTDITRIQLSGTPQEKDLLTSFHGFQLRSRVRINGLRLPNSTVKITFASWISQVTDRYDFDYKEYFTVPNPDFGSKDKDAVRPGDSTLTVYHKNAERLEKARLAAPYDIKSREFLVTDSRIIKPAEVDPGRKL